MAGKRRLNGTGTVYKDTTRNRWVGEAVIDGKRRRVTARTQTDASARIVRMITEAERGIPAGDGNITVGNVLELWRDRSLPNMDIAPSSRDGYELALHVLHQEFGTVRLRQLDIDRIERGLDAIATGKYGRGWALSRRTLVLMRSTLAQALQLAVRRRLLATNPAREAELTPTAPKPKPRQAMTVADALTLWDALDDDRLGVAFKLMMTTSMRPGETYGLCWDSIDLDTGVLELRRAVQVQRGRAVLVTDLKTDSSQRRFVVPEPALIALRAQKARVAAMKLAARAWVVDDPGLVFPTVNGGPWNPKNAREELLKACDRAGIAPVSPGILRHTAKAILDDDSVEPHVIRNLMGHSTEWMQDHYGNRARRPVDGHVAVMNRLFGGS